MSNIKQIKQVSIKDNKLKATIEVYDERTADSYQTSYQNECPIHEEFTLAMANLNSPASGPRASTASRPATRSYSPSTP